MNEIPLKTDDVHRDRDRADAARRPLGAIILAAGKGTRMNSDLPKVVHAVAGRPMLWWVVKAVRAAGAERIVIIVGHGAETVREIFAGDDDDIEFVVQEEQLGTGHATLCAERTLHDFAGDVLVLAGDGPLIRASTITRMRERHLDTRADATLATARVEDATGYGRVVRDDAGRFAAIVEHKNATPEQRAIREIYPSYACFDRAMLMESLRALEPDAVSGEYYLTEIPGRLARSGHRVEIVDAVPPEDVLSINTLEQLAQVEAILTAREENEA
ncbi:MAG: NTP transferase domain-containing protein [Planctomycetota bacterium]